jgi:hypothetical protein
MSRRTYRAALAVAAAGLVVACCYFVPRWALISPRVAEWVMR